MIQNLAYSGARPHHSKAKILSRMMPLLNEHSLIWIGLYNTGKHGFTKMAVSRLIMVRFSKFEIWHTQEPDLHHSKATIPSRTTMRARSRHVRAAPCMTYIALNLDLNYLSCYATSLVLVSRLLVRNALYCYRLNLAE